MAAGTDPRITVEVIHAGEVAFVAVGNDGGRFALDVSVHLEPDPAGIGRSIGVVNAIGPGDRVIRRIATGPGVSPTSGEARFRNLIGRPGAHPLTITVRPI